MLSQGSNAEIAAAAVQRLLVVARSPTRSASPRGALPGSPDTAGWSTRRSEPTAQTAPTRPPVARSGAGEGRTGAREPAWRGTRLSRIIRRRAHRRSSAAPWRAIAIRRSQYDPQAGHLDRTQRAVAAHVDGVRRLEVGVELEDRAAVLVRQIEVAVTHETLRHHQVVGLVAHERRLEPLLPHPVRREGEEERGDEDHRPGSALDVHSHLRVPPASPACSPTRRRASDATDDVAQGWRLSRPTKIYRLVKISFTATPATPVEPQSVGRTQAERKAETRRLLIEAAADLFALRRLPRDLDRRRRRRRRSHVGLGLRGLRRQGRPAARPRRGDEAERRGIDLRPDGRRPRRRRTRRRALARVRRIAEPWLLLEDELWLYAARNPDQKPRLAERYEHERSVPRRGDRDVEAPKRRR